MEDLIYLEVMMNADGVMGEEVPHKLQEGRKVWTGLRKVCKEDMKSHEVKLMKYGRESGDTSGEVWVRCALKCSGENKIAVFWVQGLRNIFAIIRGTV